MSTARTLFKGSFLRVFQFMAIILVTLFMTPFIIRSIGDRMYGLWVVVGSFMGFYGLFDFGMSSAVQRYVSRAIGEKDREEMNKIVNAAFFIFSSIGVVVLVATTIITLFAPFFGKNVADINLFRKVIPILGLSIAMGFPMRVFMGVLISHLRYDLVSGIEMSKLLMRTAIIYIFLKTGHGILAMAVITFTVDLCGYAGILYFYRKYSDGIVVSFKFIDNKSVKKLFSFSIFTFIAQLADRSRFDIPSFIIAAYLGLATVTIYAIAARLIGYFMDLVSNAVGIVLPVFSQYEAQNNFIAIRDKLVFITKISTYLSVCVGGTLIIFGKVFIERWVGHLYITAYPILVILAASLTLALAQNPSVHLLYGISKHKFFAVGNVVEAILNLTLSLIFVKKFGMIGVAFGLAIALVIVKLLIQPVYVCRAINLSFKNYYLNAFLKPFFIASLSVGIGWFIVKDFITASYFHIVILAVMIMAFAGLIIFFYGFTVDERQYLKKIIAPIKKQVISV